VQRVDASATRPRRPTGLRLIIGYKLVKAPLMLVLALWLTLGRGHGNDFIADLAARLAEGGWLLHRIGIWLQLSVSPTVLKGAALLAWLDTVSTSTEAGLLLLGKPWGEWLVVIGAGALLPLEVIWIAHHASWSRAGVLVVNTAVFAYLLARRLRGLRPQPGVPFDRGNP
jgi:hypothetical protein